MSSLAFGIFAISLGIALILVSVIGLIHLKQRESA